MTAFERFEGYKINNPCEKCNKKHTCLTFCSKKEEYNSNMSKTEKENALKKLYKLGV